MKRNLFITTAIFLITITSCIKENINENDYPNNTISITGAAMLNFSGENSRAETISNLEYNDSIIFSSIGGIIANRDTLVYDGLKWNGIKVKKWETNNEYADYCALHPILDEYNEANLYYNNNELKDVICCKSTTEYGKSINLSFRHLFSKIQINIDNELNRTLDKIHITIPVSIEKIDIQTGETIIKNEAKEIVLERNETSRYEIFVPACNNQTIPFKITTTDNNTYNATIKHSEYLSGYQYVCNVKYNNGIYTKEDFIAFSHLINGEEYNGRALEEFYILKNGRRVFNLFANIHFTKEETRLIKGIGPKGNEFKDIFDGNNHTISGIYYDSEFDKRSRVALFENTSENSIIRNLVIDDFTFIETKYAYYSTASFIVGYNYGTIDNCYVKSATLSINNDSKDCSAICSINHGYIINSSIESLSISDDIGRIGGICCNNQGFILNCCVNSNILRNKDVNDKVSAICQINNSIMENIYTYNYSPNNFIFEKVGSGSYIINRYIYFNKKYYGDKPENSNYIMHNDTPEDYIENAKQLNEWIDTAGRSQYPEIEFKRWSSDGTSAPMLE